MKEQQITIRLDEKEHALLSRLSKQEQKSESEIIHTARRKYCQDALAQRDAYELAQKLGVIGVTDQLPSDLSSNQDYLEGFGE